MKNLLLPLTILAYTFCTAQESGNMYYGQKRKILNEPLNAEIDENRVTLRVSGLLNADADYYVAFFNVIQVGENAAQTNTLLTARLRKFKETLADQGFDTLAVHRDFISLVPRYDYNVFNRVFSSNFNEVPDGFEMQINISVPYKKQQDLDRIVAAATSVEIYDLAKVDYFINDIEKKYGELRTRCTETLTGRIKSFEKLGFRVDTLQPLIAEDFKTILPQTRYGQYEAVARPSFRAVKKATGGDSGKVISSGNSPSVYYEAKSYDAFDVLINPAVSHPMVQLTYTITIAYNLKKPTERSVFLVDATGQIKALNFQP